MFNKNVLACLIITFASMASATDWVLNVIDPPGVGYNDETPADPIGGNTGTTLGELRMNVLIRATEIWGQVLDTDVPIDVTVSFADQECNPDEGTAVLGGANTNYAVTNFQGILDPDLYYHAALANALAGQDLQPTLTDINVAFNRNIDDDEACRGVFGGWYYGYDHIEGAQRDLLTVLIHELGHGLGFSSLARSTGAWVVGPDAFSRFMYDVTTEKFWTEMDDTERRNSGINDTNVVWNGENVTNDVGKYMHATVTELTADGIGPFVVYGSSFGTGLGSGGILSAQPVMASPADGCTTITNDLTGKIAIINRGGCEFGLKAFAAQEAGAVGVLVIDNTTGDPLIMSGGVFGSSVNIPALFVTQENGNTLTADLPNSITLSRQDGVEYVGSTNLMAQIYTPDPYQGGSSGSHFHEDIVPELLMEPISDSALGDNLDLTVPAFKDMGWPLKDAASGNSYRLLYPWLSHNAQFESVLVANNLNAATANVTLTARRAGESPVTIKTTIPSMGFISDPITDLFPTLAEGGGFSVELSSDVDNVHGRWVTLSLQAPSAASPSQGVALSLGSTDSGPNSTAQVGNAMLFGYLPGTGNTVSAPAITNAGSATTAVQLFVYNKAGDLVHQDTTTLATLAALESGAFTLASIGANVDGTDVQLIAYSPDQPLTGSVFVFDLTYLDPAIGAAQVVTFSP